MASDTSVARLKDTRLVLFFTRGVSLRTWDGGMFEREVAFYRWLSPHLAIITELCNAQLVFDALQTEGPRRGTIG